MKEAIHQTMKTYNARFILKFLLLLIYNTPSSSSPSILVVGSSNADSFLPITRFPQKGENIVLQTPNIEQNIPGGKGCNQAISISRLTRSNKVSFISRFGNDIQGKLLHKTLKLEKKIDLKLCKFTKYSSGQGIVFQNNSGEVSAFVIGGSNLYGWEDIHHPKFSSVLSKYIQRQNIRTVVLQREIPDEVNDKIVSISKECNCCIIQDLGGQDLPLSKEYMQKCDCIIPNETELMRLLLTFMPDYDGKGDTMDSIMDAAKVLQGCTGVKNIIVTLGSKGCVYLSSHSDRIEYVPSCNIPSSMEVVDETGAGDAFRGAFALFLTDHISKWENGDEGDRRMVMKEAMVFASAAGALAVTKQGAVPSLPCRKDVESFLSLQDHVQHEQPSILETRGGGGGNDFPFLIGSRLNSMKDRLDLWKDKPTNVKGFIQRQSTINGLTCIDFNYPQHFKDLTPQQAKVELDKYNLKAGAVCLRYPHELYQQGSFTHYNETIRQMAIQLTKDAANAARILGCNEVVIWSAYDGYDYSFQVQYETKFHQIVTAFQEICDAYPDIQFSLEYKPTDENTRFFVIPSTGTALYMVQEIDRENMGLTLDFGHCLMAGENPAQSISLVASKKKLFGIQLNDGYSRLAAEDGLIFGSIHPYFALEVMYYLLLHEYDGHVYFDTFPQRSDPVKEAEKNIENVNMFWRAAKRLRDLGVEEDMMVHDAIALMKRMDDALEWARNN